MCLRHNFQPFHLPCFVEHVPHRQSLLLLPLFTTHHILHLISTMFLDIYLLFSGSTFDKFCHWLQPTIAFASYLHISPTINPITTLFIHPSTLDKQYNLIHNFIVHLCVFTSHHAIMCTGAILRAFYHNNNIITHSHTLKLTTAYQYNLA